MSNLSIVSETFSKQTGKGKRKRATFICVCGSKKDLPLSKVKRGEIKSCGCLHRKYGHGLSQHPIYQVYKGMVDRCTNKKNKFFHRYGLRGIVCERKTFEQFYEDMGDGRRKGLTIDRINNDGNYCKENCRWATWKEQANNRSNNIIKNLDS